MAGNLKASELRSVLRRLDSANQALETCIQSLGECEKTLQKSIQCQNYLNHGLGLAWSPTDLIGTRCWLIYLSMQSNLLGQNLSLFVCDRGINSLQMILQALTGRKWELISTEDSQSKWQVPSSTLKSLSLLTVEELIPGISQPNFICLNLPISKMDGGSIQPIKAGFVPNEKAITFSGHATV